VDYEGPNSVVSGRRALVQYKREIFKGWELTLGIEDPDIYVDTTGDSGADQRSRAPDGGFAIPWIPGNLEALEYWSAMIALTHQWSPSAEFDGDTRVRESREHR